MSRVHCCSLSFCLLLSACSGSAPEPALPPTPAPAPEPAKTPRAPPREPPATGSSCGLSSDHQVRWLGDLPPARSIRWTWSDDEEGSAAGLECQIELQQLGQVQDGPCSGGEFLALSSTCEDLPCKGPFTPEPFWSDGGCVPEHPTLSLAVRHEGELRLLAGMLDQPPFLALAMDPQQNPPPLDGSKLVVDEPSALPALADPPDRFEIEGDQRRQVLRRSFQLSDGEPHPGVEPGLKQLGPHAFLLLMAGGIEARYEPQLPNRVPGTGFQLKGRTLSAESWPCQPLCELHQAPPWREPAIGTLQLPTLGSMPVYEPADEALLKTWHASYNRAIEQASRYSSEQLAQISYEDFLARTPLLYWLDPFGCPQRCLSMEFYPPQYAEPLVYIYAEQPTEISLAPGPGVTLTASCPTLDGAWRVITQPDGSLLDAGTGQRWPHLFWEGASHPLPRPQRGRVVARDVLPEHLRAALTAQGLRGQEIDDFLAAWLPQLQQAPWAFVTFHPQPLIDALAPLEISPAPETLIRVHMDAWPLQQPIAVEPPTYEPRPAERQGLVVVEWSGFVRDGLSAAQAVAALESADPQSSLPRE